MPTKKHVNLSVSAQTWRQFGFVCLDQGISKSAQIEHWMVQAIKARKQLKQEEKKK
jgi:hypothetical protein